MMNLQNPDNLQHTRPKHRRIRAISIAPSMLTLGNLLCGFAAIHFATRPDMIIQGPVLSRLVSTNLTLACYLIFLAMICDALDGRLARFARTTSDFGAQLDSLADVVSFGAAPAFIAMRMIINIFTPGPSLGETLVSPLAGTAFGRWSWIAAGAYLACAALRLARFNAENVPDESAHMNFKGLPSPGAAGALISLVLLYQGVIQKSSVTAISTVLAHLTPWIVFLLGLLMVSRLPYVHLVNRFLRGKKPFWMLVTIVLSVLVFILWPAEVLAIGLFGYALSGPIVWLVTLRKSKQSLATNDTNKHE
jgi:CDP-diacylglycerol--serine O-phosphatidyltransferase